MWAIMCAYGSMAQLASQIKGFGDYCIRPCSISHDCGTLATTTNGCPQKMRSKMLPAGVVSYLPFVCLLACLLVACLPTYVPLCCFAHLLLTLLACIPVCRFHEPYDTLDSNDIPCLTHRFPVSLSPCLLARHLPRPLPCITSMAEWQHQANGVQVAGGQHTPRVRGRNHAQPADVRKFDPGAHGRQTNMYSCRLADGPADSKHR